ncbi:sodium-dependent transporter [Campylobacter sp. JMF_08 NE1]|uniref:sodium-dependent transporter n=1 Tax=Campylobacter sp. JMF_08 NE1 TaxID=2983821 RepID=UPI0022E9B64D|nr:sodium-dependent transporter [Campylobacter sp. JMF_08 NE1]MDA3047194.1 sodium-dependent transporter [Campylobacter sp. JMF_08 NE1]
MNDKFSKIGFVLAVAGGAVGLGNAWKFPTLVGSNGGSAFVLLYLVLTLGIGFSLFLAEMAIGRISRADLPSAYRYLDPKNGEKWKFAGIFIVGGIFVLSFYLVILGWIMRYIFIGFSALPASVDEAGALFGGVISHSLFSSLAFYALGLVLTLFVVSRGIKSGIEKLNLIMMPLLFVLLLLMLGYAVFMEGFGEAVKFLFTPDFSKITVASVLDALGLSLFTLCIGIGCIAAYAASLGEGVKLVKSCVNIVFINIAIGLMMGLIVFTFIFEFNASPSQGAGLVFVSLTTMFAKLGFMGQILAILFFVSLFFAGITSAVSMIEPFILYLVNHFGISRSRACGLSGIVVGALGACCTLSMNAEFGESFTFFGKGFFDILDFLTSNIMLPLGALSSAIFVGFVMKKSLLAEFFGEDMSKGAFEIWYFSLRFIAPFAIIIIMVNLLFFS